MKNFNKLFLKALRTLILIIFLIVVVITTDEERMNISKIQNESKASVSTTVSSFKEISAGGYFDEGRSMAIDTEGNLWIWGCYSHSFNEGSSWYNSNYDPVRILRVKFSVIDEGSKHSLAIDADQNLWSSGNNSNGQLGNGTKTDNTNSFIKIKAGTTFKAVAAGGSHSMAIDTEGNLWTWGYNNNGQLGNGSITESLIPVKIKEGTKFEKISAGLQHSLAIDSEGNLWSWGLNNVGELGNGTTDMSIEPIKIKEGTTFKEISAGTGVTGHSLAIDSEGNLWSWGSCTRGLLGNGEISGNSLIPLQIMQGTSFKKISAGSEHNLAIDSEGKLWVWGNNDYGQLGDGTSAYSLTPKNISESNKFKEVAAGSSHSIALDQYGRMYTWGSDAYGQLGRTTNDQYEKYPGQITTSITYYTVTFMNEGNTEKTENLMYGESATAPELTKEGYTLSWDTEFSNVTSDLTVNAVWTANEVTVTFKNGTEIVKTETVTVGGSATAPSLTKAGYTLSWDQDFSNVTNDITVNAIWTPNTNTAYKVEHYKQNTSLNGYELAETENKEGTTDEEVTAIAKAYEGFTENVGYSEKVPSGSIAGDGSLVLKLYYDRNTYSVTLNTNGGTVNAGNISNYTYGVGVTLPTDVTKEGYTFGGWYDNEELTGEPVVIIGTTETGDKTYYAKWTMNEYTVIFKDGENVEKTELVKHGSNATAPELTKPGYTLSWDTDFSNVTSNLTVNAIWTANTNTPYRVEHYLRNLDTEVVGYNLQDTENLEGTTDTTVSAVAKTYEGFVENTSYSGRVASGNIAGDGSLVLKVYYDRNTYNIRYELNGGTASSILTNTYTYGKGLVLSNRVTKQGHVFVGWYENSEFTGDAITSIGTTETGDKTYYAKWTDEEEFYITSERYGINVSDEQITKVSPKTNVTTFINNINTNGTVKVLNLNGEEVTGEELVGTGYKLQVDFKGERYEYDVAARGDLDGNGKVSVTDLSILNQIMVKRLTVSGIREKAADLDYSGKTTITDLSMMNQTIVGRITL